MRTQEYSHWEKISFPGSPTPAGEQREPEQPPQSCSGVKEIQGGHKTSRLWEQEVVWECFVTETAICAQRLPEEGYPSAVGRSKAWVMTHTDCQLDSN